MTHLTRITTALLLISSLVFAVGASPANAAPGKDYFVVNTQDPASVVDSPIVEAGGVFSGCTTVTDLGGIAEQIGPSKVLFIGDKEVTCAGGSVVIHYNAVMNFKQGRKTSGHWFVVESTLPGVTDGFGTVRGDNAVCEPIAPS